MSEKKPSIGGLWIKQGKSGQYLSGYVEVGGEKLNIIAFINGYKKEAKHPDYQVYKSEPREDSTPTYKPEQDDQRQAEVNNLGATQVEVEENINPEDIPF